MNIIDKSITIEKTELFKELDKELENIQVEVKTNEVTQTKITKEML